MGDIEIGPWQQGFTPQQRQAGRDLIDRVRAVGRRGPDGLPDDDVTVLPAVLDDVVVGLAWRSASDPAELYIDPPYRGRGYGRQLAELALASGGIWAHGTPPAARALADRLGLSATRTLLQLRCELSGPVSAPIPDGVTIRSFQPGQDDAAFLAVNARAFAWHPEQGRLDAAGLAAEMQQDWFDPDGFFLAVRSSGDGDGGHGRYDGHDAAPLLGFHWTKVHPADPTPPPGRGAIARPIGEVYVIGVDPDSPVRRLGAPLTAAGLTYLAARGLNTVMLYVEADNEPALKLYARFGFVEYAVDTVFA